MGANPETEAGGSSDRILRWHRFTTPFGATYAAASAAGLARLTWGRAGVDAFVAGLDERFPGVTVIRDARSLRETEHQIGAYLAGERERFELPVDLRALGDFDRRVLRESRRIGFGQVRSYGELARRIGRPSAARAVGGALGRNPVPIVVPCHRVVRSDGTLGGYGGGVQWKERLLSLEGADPVAAS